MIEQLSIYCTDNIDPYRNLGIEEYLTFHVRKGECILFLWQNQSCVVIGKNQNCWKECRIHELEADGGCLVRRLSGGGAVFHDLGNLNFTFCVRAEDFDVNRQTDVILEAVRLLGIRAEKTGRNDLTVDGRKFSGNAFYRSGEFCYHHGTLLIHGDGQRMERYLCVSREKLLSKGVSSVRARTVNLRELKPDLTVDAVKQAMVDSFGAVYAAGRQNREKEKPEFLQEERLDWEEIEALRNRFASWEWKYGKNLPFHHQMQRRFSWGEAELQFQVREGCVWEAAVFSDGMDAGFFFCLPEVWRGCPYEAEALVQAMEQIHQKAQKGTVEPFGGVAGVDRWKNNGKPGEASLEEAAVSVSIKRDLAELIRENL